MVNLFVRALIITTIIVAVTDAIVFYVVWGERAQITPRFVILVIVVTMIPLRSISGFISSSNVARHWYRSSQKVSVEWSA